MDGWMERMYMGAYVLKIETDCGLDFLFDR